MFFVLPFVYAALVCTCIYQLLIITAFIFPLFFIFFIFTVAITLYYFIVAIFPLLTIPYFLSPLPSFSSIGIIKGQWFFHLFRKWDTIADVSINPWCNGEKKTQKVQFWKEEEEGLHFKLKVKLLWLTLSRKFVHALLRSCIYVHYLWWHALMYMEEVQVHSMKHVIRPDCRIIDIVIVGFAGEGLKKFNA